MRLLLDTHAFLWWLLDDTRISVNAERAILDLSNDLLLSSASGFEIATKVAIGKLKLPTDVTTFITDGMRQNRIDELPLTLRHTYGVATLPLHHRDPFDRLLISTAVAEGLTLLTGDPDVQKYPVPTLW